MLRWARRLLPLLAAAAVGTTGAMAQAAPVAPSPKSHRSDRVWHLDADVQTNVPVDVGVRVGVEGPARLRLSTSLGAMPGGYVRIVNAVVVEAGGYDETTANVVKSALAKSLVWRTHLGWRPLKRYGWYLEAGYGLVALGGNVTGGDVLALATGQTSAAGTGEDNFRVRSTLHMIDAEVGWQFLVLDNHLSLRAAVGFAGTLGSRTRVDPTFQSVLFAATIEELSRETERYLDDIYTTYVFTPVITVGVGYRFF